jgi:integrase
MARHRHTKPTGQKRAFSLDQLGAILGKLRVHGKDREYALCLLLRDTCLRGVDLLALRPVDLLDVDGNVRQRFTSLQRKNIKTGASGKAATVECELEAETREALAAILPMHKEGDDAPLFPITTSWLRQTIKRWVESIGLDGDLYAAHSFRRTLPAIIYKNTKDLEACRQLLGHANLDHTHAYLAVGRDDAFAAKRAALRGA